jgi:catechol 2,3-dioxygenase-like lactoylglutathione lyase family enzyme
MELPRSAKRIAGKGLPGMHHFCVYVRTNKEVDELYPLLKRRRIPIVSGPEILEVARNRSISFLDPDGNRVEVASNRNKLEKASRRS